MGKASSNRLRAFHFVSDAMSPGIVDRVFPGYLKSPQDPQSVFEDRGPFDGARGAQLKTVEDYEAMLPWNIKPAAAPVAQHAEIRQNVVL